MDTARQPKEIGKDTNQNIFYVKTKKNACGLHSTSAYLAEKHQHLGWVAQAKYPMLGCNHLEPNMPYYVERDPGALESGGHDPGHTSVESSYKWRMSQTQTHIIC